MSSAQTATDRPYDVSVPEDELADLRRRTRPRAGPTGRRMPPMAYQLETIRAW